MMGDEIVLASDQSRGPGPEAAPAGPAQRDSGAGGTGEQSTITAQAASFRLPAQRPNETVVQHATPRPGHGGFSDFEIIRVLGEGGFGRVYLARQLSLDRQVALKVTANRGHEARTLASLEHDHIVQVFSETVVSEENRRLLCMQYVPGCTLEQVIQSLRDRDRRDWSGAAILAAVDSLNPEPAVFHPAALRDRELLAEADHPQAVCWIGARLAEALDYAHSQNVLHRDIKPANILLNQYGRPYLADFNISFKTKGSSEGEDILGGTMPYMAPEHIDAFSPHDPTPHEVVDERSDIYSLGVVLFELLTGQRPFAPVDAGLNSAEALRKLATQRRGAAPSPRALCPEIPEVLDRTVRRCLEPDPRKRYASGADLARALEGSRAYRQAELELPPAGMLTAAAVQRPMLLVSLLALFPHFLGTAVNIPYNLIQIVAALDTAQEQTFERLVLVYNLVVYPLCLWGLWQLARPAFRLLRDQDGQCRCDQVDRVRRRVLSWPLWVVALSCLGWLPGGLVFPALISLRSGWLHADVFGHFLMSFTVSGLIALTYSFFGVQYAVLRVFYPRLWCDATGFRRQAQQELGSVTRRLSFFQILAGTIPLAGAVLLVSVGPETSSYRIFRLLVTGLIAMGMVGFCLAVHVNRLISDTVTVFSGRERQVRGYSRATGPAACRR